MTGNAYENATILTIANSSPKLDGFHVDTREKMGHLDIFRNGWIGRRVGDAIHFSLEASCIAVQYRKTIHRKAPVAQLVLDGDHSHPIILDSNFEEDWGDCLYLQSILHHRKREEHRIDIQLLQEGEAEKEFQLVSLIYA